jgi:hypothetical protein
VEENERMAQPTLKSILSNNRSQTHISVEELDDRFIEIYSEENLNSLFSYYTMDGSKKRVTFDEDDGELPPIETEETIEGEVEETEDVINGNESVGDLTEEFDESMFLRKFDLKQSILVF